MASPEETNRQADLDWLYGTETERPSVDQTRVMDASETAELERRRAAAAAGARAAAQPAAASGDNPARVVHREDDLPAAAAAGAKAAAREAVPAPPRQQPGVTAPRPAQPVAPAVDTAAVGGRGGSALRRATGRRGRGRRLGWLRWLLLALVAWIAYLVIVPLIAVGHAQKINVTPSGDRPPQQPGTLTLLVGSDARTGLTAAQEKQLGTGSTASAEGERTDTMMLLYSPPSGKPVLVSLPRDSYVKIPGHGHNKLNAAYAFGGAPLLVQTIEQATGDRIDQYAEVGFDGFANVVNAVGGVNVCLAKPMVDKDSHTNLPAGCQTLDGAKALGYVRMRKADPLGDLGRVKRQRQVVGIIAKKAMSPWTFINPVRYWKLNMAAFGAVKRGQDTGITSLMGIATAMGKVSSGDGYSLQVPVSDANATTSAGSSVIWDQQGAAELFGGIAKGDTASLQKFAK